MALNVVLVGRLRFCIGLLCFDIWSIMLRSVLLSSEFEWVHNLILVLCDKNRCEIFRNICLRIEKCKGLDLLTSAADMERGMGCWRMEMRGLSDGRIKFF